MLTGFSHAELVSLLWPAVGIAPKQLTTGNSANTYDAAPQPAAGIDTWNDGGTLFNNMLLLVNVSEATAGTLTITLRDSGDAITTANGAASTQLVATLATIGDTGLYYAEFMFTHVFGDTLTRVVADADNIATRRYHSIRATAAGGTFTFGVECIYGFNSRNFPVQTASPLAITWAAA
jgi:hypothetical protein